MGSRLARGRPSHLRVLRQGRLIFYTAPYSMTPALTSGSIIRGTDFALGFHFLDAAGAKISLADYAFSAVLRATGGASIASATVAAEGVDGCIRIGHAATAALAPQRATLALLVSRIPDGFQFQAISSRITIL